MAYYFSGTQQRILMPAHTLMGFLLLCIVLAATSAYAVFYMLRHFLLWIVCLMIFFYV